MKFPQAKHITLNLRDLAAAMIKHANVHEGHWCAEITFGATQAIMTNICGRVSPAAVVPVVRIGLQRVDEPHELSVDAAEINPPSPERKILEAVH